MEKEERIYLSEFYRKTDFMENVLIYYILQILIYVEYCLYEYLIAKPKRRRNYLPDTFHLCDYED